MKTPKMTRSHFQLIADTIKDFGNGEYHSFGVEYAHCLAIEFANKLRVTNAQFNRDRFLRACGVVDEGATR